MSPIAASDICEPRPAKEARAPEASAAVTTRPLPVECAGRFPSAEGPWPDGPARGSVSRLRPRSAPRPSRGRIAARGPHLCQPPAAEAHVDHARPVVGRVDERRDHARAAEVALLEDQLAVDAAPDHPVPVVAGAAGKPATCVPCPTSSPVPSAVRSRSRATLILPPRSGWPESMPESMMPTTARATAQIPGGRKLLAVRYHWYCSPSAGSIALIAGSLGTKRSSCWDLRLDGRHARMSREAPGQLLRRWCPGGTSTGITPTSGTSGRPAAARGARSPPCLAPRGGWTAARPFEQHQRAALDETRAGRGLRRGACAPSAITVKRAARRPWMRLAANTDTPHHRRSYGTRTWPQYRLNTHPKLNGRRRVPYRPGGHRVGADGEVPECRLKGQMGASRGCSRSTPAAR